MSIELLKVHITVLSGIPAPFSDSEHLARLTYSSGLFQPPNGYSSFSRYPVFRGRGLKVCPGPCRPPEGVQSQLNQFASQSVGDHAIEAEV